MARTQATNAEEEIRKLKAAFATAFLKKDAKLRASLWTEDGTVVPPQGGFFQGRDATEKHFATEAQTVTKTSRMSFSNYRFRFITPDIAFVDADITLNDVLGPDGKVHAVIAIGLEGPNGKATLADLFEGRSQLVIYHFMFGPNDKVGCPHCSLRADCFNGINEHLKHRDVTMICVSRAPYKKLAAYKKRMGWDFTWVSSGDGGFNFDYHFSFTPEQIAQGKAFFNYKYQDPGPSEREGHSVFYKDKRGQVFHTYACYSRGNELFNLHYHYLDVVPKGRDEDGRGPFWVKRHDEYGQ